jgi:hypothetical protein
MCTLAKNKSMHIFCMDTFKLLTVLVLFPYRGGPTNSDITRMQQRFILKNFVTLGYWYIHLLRNRCYRQDKFSKWWMESNASGRWFLALPSDLAAIWHLFFFWIVPSPYQNVACVGHANLVFCLNIVRSSPMALLFFLKATKQANKTCNFHSVYLPFFISVQVLE